jgi:hypothetical protein
LPGADKRDAKFKHKPGYSFTRESEQLHFDNRHVRDKIRQSRNGGMLRDAGILLHIETGRWRLP